MVEEELDILLKLSKLLEKEINKRLNKDTNNAQLHYVLSDASEHCKSLQLELKAAKYYIG